MYIVVQQIARSRTLVLKLIIRSYILSCYNSGLELYILTQLAVPPQLVKHDWWNMLALLEMQDVRGAETEEIDPHKGCKQKNEA